MCFRLNGAKDRKWRSALLKIGIKIANRGADQLRIATQTALAPH
jgi:hypothetical protein